VASSALASRNGVTNGRALVHERPAEIRERELDLVLANPPYFSGFRIARAFVQAAARALKPSGRIYRVAKALDTLMTGELYIRCMARKRRSLTTVRLDPEDVAALARARKAGVSASALIRRGLRVVAARYYSRRALRAPTTGLFVSTDPKLGDESELFKELEGWQGR
jgi:hypothetical protein